jgi:pyruvate formate lyase activating enzyme
MIIGGLQKLTLIDFPGKLAATVFLSGCPFRCPWCYSSELVLPEKIEKQPKISQKEFFDFLEEKKGLLEGVVICGGEPTMNSDLPDFAEKIKRFGYAIKLDTNGTNPEMLKNLIEKKLIDYIAMDIKAPLTMNYESAVGVKVDLEKIKESVEIIKSSGVDYEFRTTVIPDIHTKEDIVQIAKDIGPAKRYFLQKFRPEKTLNSEFEKIKPYSREYLLGIIKSISPFFYTCQLRG